MNNKDTNTMRLILIKDAVAKLEESIRTLEMTEHIDWYRFVEDIRKAVEVE